MARSDVASAAVPVLVAFLCSCAAPAPQPVAEAPAISAAGKIDIAAVRVAKPPAEGIDAAALFEVALRREFEQRQMLWANQPGAERFSLDVNITTYEPGNAFKRWLLPGYGATVLAVRGSLRASDGRPAGAFEHSRGVYWGGLYTVGAWQSIFDQVAADIARDLDNRVHRRGFTITLAPWSSRQIEVAPASQRRRFGGVTTRDLRPDRGRIGTRTAAFGVSMGDVFFAREVPDYMSEAVADQLRAAGHTVGASDGAPVAVDVSTFWLHTDTTVLYWDVVAEIAMDVTLGTTPTRRLECRSVERTYVWPTDELLGSVLDRCLTELMAKLGTADG